MPWLLRDGRVLASVEVADSRAARRRGLLGRDGIDGALLLPATRSVHTVRMRFPIDVAFLDPQLVVLKSLTLRPWRTTLPVRSARSVIEAAAGAFAAWDLTVGDQLELEGEA